MHARTAADYYRDVIVPALPRQGPGTRYVKILSTSELIYLGQATRDCDSSRGVAVVKPPLSAMPDPVRGSGRPNNLARERILLNRKASKLPPIAPTSTANGGVPCCEGSAEFEMACRRWLVRAVCCMMHDQSARESSALDEIVGVPYRCFSKLAKEVTRSEASSPVPVTCTCTVVDEHVWNRTIGLMAGPWITWDAARPSICKGEQAGLAGWQGRPAGWR